MNRTEGFNQGAMTVNRFAFAASLFLALLTSITFIIAFLTPPLSGPLCPAPLFTYPYTDIVSRFPRDYYWMVPAMVMVILFVIYTATLHHAANNDAKLFSQIAVVFAAISAGILFVDYFVQISVVQPSLINGEFESIGLLSQYNPHGLFIALEEAGYLLMAIAILFLRPVFAGPGRVRAVLRWTAVLNFFLSLLSLGLISFFYGISREYRFEIAVISFNFIALILLGMLTVILFWTEIGRD